MTPELWFVVIMGLVLLFITSLASTITAWRVSGLEATARRTEAVVERVDASNERAELAATSAKIAADAVLRAMRRSRPTLHDAE